jgi:hypothetical protein
MKHVWLMHWLGSGHMLFWFPRAYLLATIQTSGPLYPTASQARHSFAKTHAVFSGPQEAFIASTYFTVILLLGICFSGIFIPSGFNKWDLIS